MRKRIFLIRHGQSVGNVDRTVYSKIPDWQITLTSKGKKQAQEAGTSLKRIIGEENVMFYVSPFVRAMQTYEEIKKSFISNDKGFIQDPRVREHEWGRDPEETGKINPIPTERQEYGEVFYRYRDGESIFDVYDRANSFIDTLFKKYHDGESYQNTVIISHGEFIKVFLYRWFNWTTDEYLIYRVLKNCEYIIFNHKEKDKFDCNYDFLKI